MLKFGFCDIVEWGGGALIVIYDAQLHSLDIQHLLIFTRGETFAW